MTLNVSVSSGKVSGRICILNEESRCSSARKTDPFFGWKSAVVSNGPVISQNTLKKCLESEV